jgi:hypothetical protein
MYGAAGLDVIDGGPHNGDYGGNYADGQVDGATCTTAGSFLGLAWSQAFGFLPAGPKTSPRGVKAGEAGTRMWSVLTGRAARYGPTAP